jgi:hypothetical protein
MSIFLSGAIAKAEEMSLWLWDYNFSFSNMNKRFQSSVFGKESALRGFEYFSKLHVAAVNKSSSFKSH